MSPQQLYAVYLTLLFISTTVDGGGFNGESSARLRNRILNLIELPIRYYLHAAQVDRVDANLMLGVSIMKGMEIVELLLQHFLHIPKSYGRTTTIGYKLYDGQLMSCTDHYDNDFNRMHRLMRMINELYTKFYENNNYLADSKITSSRKMFDYNLWTSSSKIIRSSLRTLPAVGGLLFDADRIADGDLFYRNISDKCIFQAISACQITSECVVPELAADGVSGYALTHQAMYAHILQKMHCADSVFKRTLDEIIRDKCGKIYNEAMSIANDVVALEKYKDLFIEQIAICGMQNMVEFIRPEWLSIVVSINDLACGSRKDLNCDSHLTGVSLASLGVYWKFLCYKLNTYGSY